VNGISISTSDTAATTPEDILLTTDEAQIMISESELVSELMNAWSIEVTNLLEQMTEANELNKHNSEMVNNILSSVQRSHQVDNNNDNNKWKTGGLQQMAEEMKSRMVHKSKQALEKHRSRRLQQRTSEDEDEDEDKDEDESEDDGDEDKDEQEKQQKKNKQNQDT